MSVPDANNFVIYSVNGLKNCFNVVRFFFRLVLLCFGNKRRTVRVTYTTTCSKSDLNEYLFW